MSKWDYSVHYGPKVIPIYSASAYYVDISMITGKDDYSINSRSGWFPFWEC